eukprot:769623-Pleurochrysis_carterae.AAC.1
MKAGADAAREAADEELVGDSLQDRQPSVPPVLDARLVGRKLEVRWRYILTPTPGSTSHAPNHTYMWCEGE